MAVPVAGYPNLRYVGGAEAKPAEQQLLPGFLSLLQQAASRLGVVFDIFSGSGGPGVRGGGFAGDPHERRIGADINVQGSPVGSYPGAVSVLHSLGLRSGATDFTYQGRPDPAHVDAVSSTGAVKGAAAATGSSIDSPETFWYALETKLGLPHTRATHNFLQGWANVEGTKAAYNPLATTLRQPGSTGLAGNPDGVQNYPTPEAGVQATADTIKGGYPAILAVLKGKQPPYGNTRFNAELNKWSGQPGKGAAVTPYVRGWLLQAQGNPSGKDATDWFSRVGSGVTGAITGAAEAALAVPHFLEKITNAHNILRGLQVIAGAVLVLVGVTLLARQVGLAADLPKPPVALPVPVP